MSRNKPHNFKDRTGERRQNKKGDWMTITECFDAKNNTVTFDTGKVKHGVAWQDFKIGKVEHPLVYEETIAYHIECELGENLYDIVNMKKCKELGLDPYEIKRGSKIELWFLCQKVDYHNDSDGYKCSCNHFTSRNQRCPLCSPHPKHIHIKDSIVSRPDILNMILIPENNLTLEDCAKLSPGSSKSFYVKHSKCGRTSSKKTQIRNITNNVWHCEYCYVGISMSEKFMSNILYQLKEQKQIDSFKNHVQSNILSWANNYEYDFYVTKNIITYIFETHGIQHYEEIDGKWGRGLEFEQENDRLKRELALDNNIDIYEEIDCRESTFEWLKENIMTKLSQYFDLSNIDWKLAWKESQDTKVSECWLYGIVVYIVLVK